jgi:hypothetical protein
MFAMQPRRRGEEKESENKTCKRREKNDTGVARNDKKKRKGDVEEGPR